MSVYVGEEARAYYVEETNYGSTPPTPAMLYIGIIQNVEPALDPKNIVIRGIGSRTPKSIRRTVRAVDLSLVYIPQDWDFWAYVTNLKSVSLEVLYFKGAFATPTAVISLNHAGLKIDKAKIEGSIEDPIKITMNCIAQDLAPTEAKMGASYENESTNDPITNLNCVIKKSGVEITRFSDFSFEIINNYKRHPVIRSTNALFIKALIERQQNLTGSITADFESKEELDNIRSDTSFPLAFEIGPAGNKKIFTFGGCKWRNAKTPTKIEDLVAQKLEFDALTLAET
jgi:hypothetical protein